MWKISVAFGPGQHRGEIEEFLLKEGLLAQKLMMYPELSSTCYVYPAVTTRRFPWFSAFERVIWGVWTKLPFLKKFRSPESVTFALADWILSRELSYSQVFVGWSMVSLHCMRKARRMGARVYLEYPIAHIDEWMQIVRSEYAAWGRGTGYYSLIPRSIVNRTRKECLEAETIIVHSSYVKKSFLKRGIPGENLIITPLGIDHELFAPKIEYNNEGPLKILFVGRIELLKGIQYLLKALSTLAIEEIELHLVGRVLPEFVPILERYENLSIVLHGQVDRDRLPEFYKAADIFVFPTVNDSFGMVVLEAMSSGLPVIVTENSCGPDVVTEGIDGFVVPIRDPQALAARIQYFLNNREQIRHMGQRAHEKVAGAFTSQHYRERLNAIYSVPNSI